MNNELLLLSKNDIPFVEAQVSIHQPTLREIALIGEENFFSGCKVIQISKNSFSEQDRKDLEDKSDFDIFMSIMCSKERPEYKNSVLMVFALLFPDYQVKVMDRDIILVGESNTARINDLNFESFKEILNLMFSLKESEGANGDYNPSSKRAEKIAEKLRKHKEKVANQKGETSKVAVFSRYASILAIGLQKDLNDLMEYTVFQIMDEFKRFQLKQAFDIYIQAKMAGAQDLEEVDNWMDDIHP